MNLSIKLSLPSATWLLVSNQSMTVIFILLIYSIVILICHQSLFVVIVFKLYYQCWSNYWYTVESLYWDEEQSQHLTEEIQTKKLDRKVNRMVENFC